MINRYFLILNKPNYDLEEIIVKNSRMAFKVIFSKSIIYFFDSIDTLNIKKYLNVESIFINITNVSDISLNIKDVDQHVINDFLKIFNKSEDSVDEILDKMIKNGYSASCLTPNDIDKLNGK